MTITEPKWVAELRQLPFRPAKVELALNFYDELKTPAIKRDALSKLEYIIIEWYVRAEKYMNDKEMRFTKKERDFYNWTLNF